MRVLLALTYYRPHLSGLTVYVERLGRELARRGHEVTVLAARHDPALPAQEERDGVRVVRVPVTVRRGKGVVMGGYPRQAVRLAREADVVSGHLPQLEAPLLALAARRARRPLVLTYHCDLQLPPGAFNRVADGVTFAANLTAIAAADRVVAYTADYARHSPLLRRFPGRIETILPPVVAPEPPPEAVAAFRATHGLEPGVPVLGMAARLAAEKGVEVVLDALPRLQERFPGTRVLFAGPYEDVLGEEAYRERLRPALERAGDRWRFLGVLGDDEMPAFLAALDCLLVPSLNRTESFGLVQVEAMLCGTPVVASDLPGVRRPVQMTGMGEVAAIGDAASLADAVGRVLADPSGHSRPREEIARRFDLAATVDAYEALFESLARR